MSEHVLTTEQAKFHIQQVWAPEGEHPTREWERKAEERQNEILAKWKDWLWSKYGSELPDSVKGLVYDEAWLAGYQMEEVERSYKSLCNFARNIIRMSY